MTALAPEDRARLLGVRRELATLRLAALTRMNADLAGADRARVRALGARDPERWSTDELRQIARLAWRYRRVLSRHLSPSVNPDDPLAPQWEEIP